MTTTTTDYVGKTVTVKPAHRARSFKLTVEQVEGEGRAMLLIGRIPSAKHLGDFIGKANAWVTDVIEADR